jgi:hypothetical protein
MTPEGQIHVRTPDILAYAQYEWYEPVWYVEKSVDMTSSRRKLGHWLGVTEDQGTSMTYVILPKSCGPIVRTSVFPVSENWRLNPKYHAELKELNDSIQAKIGDKLTDDKVEELLPGVLPTPNDIMELFDGEDLTVEPVQARSR